MCLCYPKTELLPSKHSFYKDKSLHGKSHIFNYNLNQSEFVQILMQRQISKASVNRVKQSCCKRNLTSVLLSRLCHANFTNVAKAT